jgi:hypothetical protein
MIQRKEVMPTAKSRSELSLSGAEIPHFTGNRLRNISGFAEGKRMKPGPGKNDHCFFAIDRSAAMKQSQKGAASMRQA